MPVGGAACGALAVAAGSEVVYNKVDEATLMRRRSVPPAVHGGRRRGGGSLYVERAEADADANGGGGAAAAARTAAGGGEGDTIESEWEARVALAARENRL